MNQAPTIKKVQFDFAHNNAGLMNQTLTINLIPALFRMD